MYTENCGLPFFMALKTINILKRDYSIVYSIKIPSIKMANIMIAKDIVLRENSNDERSAHRQSTNVKQIVYYLQNVICFD